jgi:VWFA-related protein
MVSFIHYHRIVLVVLLLASTGLTTTANCQQTTETLESVTLTLTVTDKSGRYIGGLRKDQVTVLDQQQSRNIISFKEADVPMTIGFVFDLSTLRHSDVFRVVHNSVMRFMADGHQLNEYFLIGFNEKSYLAAHLTNDRSKIAEGLAMLADIKPSSKTALNDAIQLSVKTVDAGQCAKRVIIIVSENEVNASSLERGELLELIKNHDVLLYPIRLKTGKNDADSGALGELSSVSGGMPFYPRTSAEFTDAFEIIGLELRHQYSLEYKSEKPSPNSWHSLNFRIKPLRLKDSREVELFPRSRSGYYSRP